MVDVVALLMLLIALLLAPADEKEITIDALEPAQGRIETLLATRTAEGFSIKPVTMDGDAILVKRHPEKKNVFVMGETEVDASDLIAELIEAKTPERSAKHGDDTIRVATRGNVQYVCATGHNQVFVRRPAPAKTAEPAKTDKAEKTYAGTLKVRQGPARMSVDAYQFGDITLKCADMRTLTLVATETCKKEDLEKLDGKKVELVGVEEEAGAPDPREAHPTGPDGKALKRANRIRVRSVKVVE
jgi:hypothetical protein